MGSSKSRKKKRVPSKSSNEDSLDKTCRGEDFSHFVQPPKEGITRIFLENSYNLLASLSSTETCNAGESVSALDEFGNVVCHNAKKLSFLDARELSNVLFKEMQERFENLYSSFCSSGTTKDFSFLDSVEVLTLIFRCCMLLLILLASQRNLIFEKGLILLKILKKLTSVNLSKNTRRKAFLLEKSVFCESGAGENECGSSFKEFTASLQFLEPRSPLLCLKCSILEVFIDELLAHGRLRGYIKLINSTASVNDMLFNPQHSRSDTAVLAEAICFHFIASFSSKQGLGEFLSLLFCFHAKESRYPLGAPALSIKGAVSLLLNPIMVSAPKYLQFHLISLVSEVIDFKIVELDNKMINCFLSTFEKSVILYMTHMYSSKNGGYTTSLGSLMHISPKDMSTLQFESYISPETRKWVDIIIEKMDHSSDVSSGAGFFMMKSDMVGSCMRFVKECQNTYAMQSNDEVFAILTCLVLKASENCDHESVQPFEGETLRDISLVVSLLKLMSISMLQSIRSLRICDLCCYTSCKEYKFMLNTITCFRDLEASLPLQQVLSSVMGSHPSRHIDSKMMLLHFSGLLSLSFVSGIDCLAKGCLLIILAVLSLFVFEDGMDTLKLMLASLKQSLPCELSVVRVDEALVGQNSSIVVAMKFQKTRSLWSRERQGLEEETEETCNGEMLFKCIINKGENEGGLNDIVDYVECKQGKDYSAWLKNREKYRKWRCEKMAVLKWRKRKNCWKSTRGKQRYVS